MVLGFDPRALGEPVGRRLVGSYLASLIGDYMVLAAVPIAVAAISGGSWVIGGVLAVQAFAVLAGLPLGGLIGDRLPRRSVMIAADLVRFGAQAAAAGLLILGEATLWELLVTQAIQGLATGLFMPSAEAVVPDVVRPGGIQPTNGSKRAAWSIAAVAGPALGATVAAAAGPGWAMAVDAATFFLSAALLTGVPAAPRREEPQTIGEQLREAWEAFTSRPWLASVVLQWTLINALALAPFFVLGPVLSDERFGGASGWAWMLFGLGAGELVGSLMATRWKPDRPLVAGLSRATLWAVPVVLVVSGAPLPFVVAGLALAGFGLMSFDVVWKSTVQTEIPERQRARVIVLDLIGSLAVVPLGYIFGAWAAAAISPSAALVAGGVFVVGSTIVVLAVPSVRGLEARTAAATPGGEVL